MSDAATLDWVHLPAGVEPMSLWEPLHDGEIRALRSDLLERSVTLEIDVYHLRRSHDLGEDFRFLLRLGGVRSVRATRHAFWPGGFTMPDGTPYEEQRRLVAEYHAKGREHSVDWATLETALEDPERFLDISHAELTAGAGTVALRLQCMLDGDEWHDLYLYAESLEVAGSDGRALTLEEFLRLGHDYWEAFSRRRLSAPDAAP